MPKNPHIKKVLVIGSGPIVIGQAAEFDYAGTQACRALREEGIEVVLVNSNPATIMTDPDMADKVYIEPLSVPVIRNIIKKERPDSMLATLGGQTGLNLAMELAESGALAELGVKLLGTSVESIHKAENREAFKALMDEIGEPVIESVIAKTPEQALDFARLSPDDLVIDLYCGAGTISSLFAGGGFLAVCIDLILGLYLGAGLRVSWSVFVLIPMVGLSMAMLVLNRSRRARDHLRRRLFL